MNWKVLGRVGTARAKPAPPWSGSSGFLSVGPLMVGHEGGGGGGDLGGLRVFRMKSITRVLSSGLRERRRALVTRFSLLKPAYSMKVSLSFSSRSMKQTGSGFW